MDVNIFWGLCQVHHFWWTIHQSFPHLLGVELFEDGGLHFIHCWLLLQIFDAESPCFFPPPFSIFLLKTMLLHIFQAYLLSSDYHVAISLIVLEWNFEIFLMFCKWRIIVEAANINWRWVGMYSLWNWLFSAAMLFMLRSWTSWPSLHVNGLRPSVQCFEPCALKNQLLSRPLGWWVLGSLLPLLRLYHQLDFCH